MSEKNPRLEINLNLSSSSAKLHVIYQNILYGFITIK